MIMNIKNLLKGKRVVVWRDKFAMAKVSEIPGSYFALIKDKKEISVVIDEKFLDKIKYSEMSKDYRILTFDFIIPFNTRGFMSTISTALAKNRISILTFSAFSTDHIMVKDKDLKKAEKVLSKLGLDTKEM